MCVCVCLCVCVRGPVMSRPTLGATLGADEVVAETFKVLVLGNSDVGKTSLVKLYTTGEVATKLLPTVGEMTMYVVVYNYSCVIQVF